MQIRIQRPLKILNLEVLAEWKSLQNEPRQKRQKKMTFRIGQIARKLQNFKLINCLLECIYYVTAAYFFEHLGTFQQMFLFSLIFFVTYKKSKKVHHLCSKIFLDLDLFMLTFMYHFNGPFLVVSIVLFVRIASNSGIDLFWFMENINSHLVMFASNHIGPQ